MQPGCLAAREAQSASKEATSLRPVGRTWANKGREYAMAEVSYFYVYKDVAGQWRWRFTAKNGKIIAVSSESYINLSDCEHSVVLMRQESQFSPVIGDEHFDRLRK